MTLNLTFCKKAIESSDRKEIKFFELKNLFVLFEIFSKTY